MIIEWPETLIATEGFNCDITVTTEITYLGAAKLGSKWVEVNYEDRTLKIDTKSSAVEAITEDLLILAKISTSLFDESI